MPVKRKFSISGCYGIFFLILTLLMGLIFLLQAASTYADGTASKEEARREVIIQAEKEGWSEAQTQMKAAAAVEQIPIYSAKIVSERLGALLPYVCIWFIALIGDIVITVRTPAKATAPKRNPELMMADRLKNSRSKIPSVAKSNHENDFEAACTAIEKLRKTSRLLRIFAVALFGICLLFPLLYFLDFSHFPNENLNGEVVHAVLFTLPFLLVLLSGAITYTFLHDSLMKKESAAIQAAVLTGDRSSVSKVPPRKQTTRKIWILRVVCLGIGIGLVVLGCFNGSVHDVFIKATKICTECIGLG